MFEDTIQVLQSKMSLKLTFGILGILLLTHNTDQQIPTPGPVSSTLRDLVIGGGAVNVICDFYKEVDGEWELIASKLTSTTGIAGSVNTLIHPDNFTYTNYKFVFDSTSYYNSRGFQSFYPNIEIIFEKKDEINHLVIVSMSPYGYSAYRGTPKVVI